ncbi:hypothetical protein ACOTHJ_15385 [Achromobacter xylosoxidans]
MQLNFEANGALTFVLETGDRDDIENLIDQAERCANNIDHSVLSSMLDFYGYIGNGVLRPIQASSVGALTDAPMFSDDVDIEDDGKEKVRGRVWWFPDYAVKSFAHDLMDKGSVTFQLGQPVGLH